MSDFNSRRMSSRNSTLRFFESKLVILELVMSKELGQKISEMKILILATAQKSR